MNLSSLKIFFCRNYVKIVIICTVTVRILQVLSKQYLKSHPEFLKNTPVIQKNSRRRRFISPRGGAIIHITGITIKIGVTVLLDFIAKKGLMTGIVTDDGILITKKILATAISAYLRDSFPQNLPHLEKKKFILVGREKIYIDQCDQNLEYLFKILEEKAIPFEEKKSLARSILTKYLDMKTMNVRIAFTIYSFNFKN